WRALSPGAKAAPTIVTRNQRDRAGRGNTTVPAAPTGSGGELPPLQLTRTSVGRRTGSRAGAIRSRLTVNGPAVRQPIHGGGAAGRTQIPTQAVDGSPSKALEAR